MRRIIISTGGTGGHIFPAIAVAEALKSMLPNVNILFVGAKGKMEMEKVPKAGFEIIGLWISGFQRKWTLQNLMFPFKVLSSMWKSRSIIHDFKPEVVVGFGGYASGTMLKTAASNGIPTVIQEQNSYAGLTNKLLAAKAKCICVAYSGMEKFFPSEKIVVTGNPVREALQNNVSKHEAAKFYDIDINKKTVLIIGGSLGARTLNQAIAANYELVRNHPNYNFLWQCGKLYEEQYQSSEIAALPNVKMITFIERMDYAYALADIVISRAGALSISELCLVGKAVILVPSPNVAEDHQTKNAMALVEKNAALLVKDADAKENLFVKAIELMENETEIKKLATNINLLSRPNAANDIAHQIIKWLP